MNLNFSKPTYLILIILVVSGFTHVWNAVGFPDIFFDEGVYMRRAMHVLTGLGPQEAYFHDHPFFGQIFLASILWATGFPNSLHPVATPSSISTLYLEPRIIMGLLAVADTFLIYKIADNRYGTKIALISSILFAVMPITWLLRRILLDSILLPFLLLSILLALNSKNSKHRNLTVLLSGICLGLAIFTKIPVFTMIPLVAGLIYFYNGKKSRLVILWLVPVLMLPLLWPLQSIEAGQFNLWVRDVISQTQRASTGLPYISEYFVLTDPVLFILGISGIIFCVVRKDYFILMWFVPFIIFLLAIGYNQYFYWIPVLPVFCISAAMLLVKTFERIKREDLKNLPITVVLCITAFGLISTVMVISTNMSISQFQATAFVLQNVKDNDNQTTILASPSYSWIFNYVFHKENVFLDYSLVQWQPVDTPRVVLIADQHYEVDTMKGSQLEQIYNESKTVASFDINNLYDIGYYPYTNLKVNWEGSHIDIKEK
ncbi:MAG TPA: glycosyltransferase family 39 protein [Candidatus Bathyarchaeia archaeon]|nr:glycosyltransferase family 39 protein [Candidatus Bathyarchaeia archaeon]